MKPNLGTTDDHIDQTAKLFLGFGVQAMIRDITGLMVA